MPPLRVFYHVAGLGNWRKVVSAQLSVLDSSGLREAAEMYVTLTGEACGIQVGAVAGVREEVDVGRFEFPTLAWAQAMALARSEESYVLYLHTRGASRPDSVPVWDHGRMMDYFLIERWRDVLPRLDEGYECAGCDPGYFPDLPGRPFHFSGNCWWARSSFLRRLPKVRSLDWRNRFAAEAWIGMGGQPNAFTLHASHVNHYDEPYPRERYALGATGQVPGH